MEKRTTKNLSNSNLTTLVIIIFLFIITIIFYLLKSNLPINNGIPDDSYNIPDNYVTQIIDGDTFKTADGKTIRLLCIDTPEKNEKGYEEAKEYLSSLIENKEVSIKGDINADDKDDYGRLLRYVYILDPLNNTLFINKDLVDNNYASFWKYDENNQCW